jgi:hypothetical protein
MNKAHEKLGRWIDILFEYDLEVVHTSKSPMMVEATDDMRRMPDTLHFEGQCVYLVPPDAHLDMILPVVRIPRQYFVSLRKLSVYEGSLKVF